MNRHLHEQLCRLRDQEDGLHPARVAEWLEESGWLEAHGDSPFIAPPIKKPDHGGPNYIGWQIHCAFIADELHKRSHELNASYDKWQHTNGCPPDTRDFFDFIKRLANAVAYAHNCNSARGVSLLPYDRIELAAKLRHAVAALRQSPGIDRDVEEVMAQNS